MASGINPRAAISGRAWLSLLAAIVPAAIFWSAQLESGWRSWELLFLWLAGAVTAIILGQAALLESWRGDRRSRALSIAGLILGAAQLPAIAFVAWAYWQSHCMFCLLW